MEFAAAHRGDEPDQEQGPVAQPSEVGFGLAGARRYDVWPTAATYNPPMSMARGTIFAGYVILRLIGQGGMGEVYLAQHPRLPRRDALKILSTSGAGNSEFHQRFIREADLAATLFHPHIVGVHDRGDYENQLWISMDYVDGTDTAELLRHNYPAGMPVGEALAIAKATASALDYACERGIVHRDVKPANILLTQPDQYGHQRILLADFGIARPLTDPSGLTATNLTIGTVAYASPEQLMGNTVDGRSDQYSLAATLFHLLAGIPPYQYDNPIAVVGNHLNGPIPRLSDHRRDLAHLDAAFAKALAKDPSERFETCGLFSEALAGGSAAVSISQLVTQTRSAASSGDTSTVTQHAPLSTVLRRPARSTLVVLGLALAVVVVVAVGTARYVVHGTFTAPAALDGTYRLTYDTAKLSHNGAPEPAPVDRSYVKYWAFRSTCPSSQQCMATGTMLDDSDHQVAKTPAQTAVLHFADGRWSQTNPGRAQVESQRCLGPNDAISPGEDTAATLLSMTPQHDGTLSGIFTQTAVTNECGRQGLVLQVPFVAIRTGTTPATILVADPERTTTDTSTPNIPPPMGGTIKDGTYRVELNQTQAMVDGHPEASGPNLTSFWALRSLCTPVNCIATGAGLAADQRSPTGQAVVVQFRGGQWQSTPSLQQPHACASGSGQSVDEQVTLQWLLQPEANDTLTGSHVITIVTNDCGNQGKVETIPLIATRIADVPPTAVLADPALF